MTAISTIVPSNFVAIDQDIACLEANDQNWLDVSFLPDQKSFRLVKIDFWTKVHEFFNKSLKQARFDRLKDYSKNTLALFEKYSWRYDATCIEHFYTKGLAKWSLDVFDRTTLSEKIQNVVCKNLGKFRERQNVKKSYYQPLPEEKIELAKLQVELALKLGIKPQKNKKGVNGSIIYYDIGHKPIGIFKAENTIRSTKEAFKQWFSSILGFRTQSDLCHHDQPHAEVAASIADDVFSIGLVPLTRKVELEGRKGSLMLWEQNMKDAASFNFSNKPTEKELYLFQQMAVYDFLFGNLDRHTENWLVQVNKTNQIEKIAMIDNGNAFPEELPTSSISDYFGRQKMYRWKSHPWAKYPFQERVLDCLRNLSSWNLRKFADEVSSHLQTDFLSGKRLENFRLRASFLQELPNLRGYTPALLGNHMSAEQIKQSQ